MNERAIEINEILVLISSLHYHRLNTSYMLYSISDCTEVKLCGLDATRGAKYGKADGACVHLRLNAQTLRLI
jgi:hypothetical protein